MTLAAPHRTGEGAGRGDIRQWRKPDSAAGLQCQEEVKPRSMRGQEPLVGDRSSRGPGSVVRRVSTDGVPVPVGTGREVGMVGGDAVALVCDGVGAGVVPPAGTVAGAVALGAPLPPDLPPEESWPQAAVPSMARPSATVAARVLPGRRVASVPLELLMPV